MNFSRKSAIMKEQKEKIKKEKKRKRMHMKVFYFIIILLTGVYLWSLHDLLATLKNGLLALESYFSTLIGATFLVFTIVQTGIDYIWKVNASHGKILKKIVQIVDDNIWAQRILLAIEVYGLPFLLCIFSVLLKTRYFDDEQVLKSLVDLSPLKGIDKKAYYVNWVVIVGSWILCDMESWKKVTLYYNKN